MLTAWLRTGGAHGPALVPWPLCAYPLLSTAAFFRKITLALSLQSLNVGASWVRFLASSSAVLKAPECSRNLVSVQLTFHPGFLRSCELVPVISHPVLRIFAFSHLLPTSFWGSLSSYHQTWELPHRPRAFLGLSSPESSTATLPARQARNPGHPENLLPSPLLFTPPSTQSNRNMLMCPDPGHHDSESFLTGFRVCPCCLSVLHRTVSGCRGMLGQVSLSFPCV